MGWVYRIQSPSERNAKMSATKAAQYEAKLAALPPEEANRKRKASEKAARIRAKRRARMQNVPDHNTAKTEDDESDDDYWL